MTKQETKQKEAELLQMIQSFCSEHLDDDYLQLCEKLIKKMGRKREVPFKRGKLEIWAAAVVHSIGSINFLFDKSFEPYMSVGQICDYFGTKKSTVSQKAKQIQEMCKLNHFCPEFSTQKMVDDNPFNNMVMVDGLIVPLNSLPLDLQEQVKAARAMGHDVQFQTKS